MNRRVCHASMLPGAGPSVHTAPVAVAGVALLEHLAGRRGTRVLARFLLQALPGAERPPRDRTLEH
jgi:hypothetical protein